MKKSNSVQFIEMYEQNASMFARKWKAAGISMILWRIFNKWHKLVSFYFYFTYIVKNSLHRTL